MKREKTWSHRGSADSRPDGRKYADWSPLYSDSTGWYRWFNGEGWRKVTGPEEGAQRASA